MKTTDIKPGTTYAVSTFADYRGYAMPGRVVGIARSKVYVDVSVYDELDDREVVERRIVRPQDIRETWDAYVAAS